MLQSDALIVDYGPQFEGSAVQVGDGIVCVVPSEIRTRPEVQATMRELVRDLGGECGQCGNCPLGQSR